MPAEPTYTYSFDPQTDDKDAVRYYLADTNHDNLGWMLSDQEILFQLAQDGSPLYAAASCAEAIGARRSHVGSVSSKRIGDLAISYNQSAIKDWTDVAKMLRKRASRGAVPYAGGINTSDKVGDQVNPTLTHPAFRRGQFDPLNVPREEGGPVGSTYGEAWPEVVYP